MFSTLIFVRIPLRLNFSSIFCFRRCIQSLSGEYQSLNEIRSILMYCRSNYTCPPLFEHPPESWTLGWWNFCNPIFTCFYGLRDSIKMIKSIVTATLMLKTSPGKKVNLKLNTAEGLWRSPSGVQLSGGRVSFWQWILEVDIEMSFLHEVFRKPSTISNAELCIFLILTRRALISNNPFQLFAKWKLENWQ